MNHDNEPEPDPMESSPEPPSQLQDEQTPPSEPADEDGNPLLFVDVNLGPGRAERIVVYNGDTAEGLAAQFAEKHGKSLTSGLDDNLQGKLVDLLEG